jgi:hypothetical protein
MNKIDSSSSNSSTNSITPEDLLAQIRVMRTQIPEYTQQPEYSIQTLASLAAIDPHFVDASTGAIGASAQLQQGLGATPEVCVQESSDASRWAQVEDEIGALFTGVRNGNLARRHRIGVRALQTYQMTKQLVRISEHADLKPHLAEMRKHNRYGKGRATATRKSPAPAPAPSPAPAAAEPEPLDLKKAA